MNKKTRWVWFGVTELPSKSPLSVVYINPQNCTKYASEVELNFLFPAIFARPPPSQIVKAKGIGTGEQIDKWNVVIGSRGF